MTKNEMYMTWLQNAYDMEVDITKTLEGQLDDAKDYPDVEKLIKKHLKETEGHVEKVKMCIERMGGDISTIKSGMAAMTGMMKGASMGMMHDKVIKNSIANFATEHLEIASYTVLIDTAKEVGDDESIPVFESIRKEEEATAEELAKGMSKILKEFLATHDES